MRLVDPYSSKVIRNILCKWGSTYKMIPWLYEKFQEENQ